MIFLGSPEYAGQYDQRNRLPDAPRRKQRFNKPFTNSFPQAPGDFPGRPRGWLFGNSAEHDRIIHVGSRESFIQIPCVVDVRGRTMKPLTMLVPAIAIAPAALAALLLVAGHAEDEASPVLGGKIPSGYRDWGLICRPRRRQPERFARRSRQRRSDQGLSGGKLRVPRWHDHRASLPGVISRQRKTTKPLAVRNLSLPGLPRTFSSWSKTRKNTPLPARGCFIDDGKLAHVVALDCFACHVPAKARDYLFTHYAP